MNFPPILKWVGYGTAILSFAAAAGGVVKSIADRAENRRHIEGLLAVERNQKNAHDYATAWQTLDKAAAIDANSASVQAAQEDLAMDWLENIQVEGDARFSDITQKLDPVLSRGIASSKSNQRQADLMAHLGWSYFLRSREGAGGLDPSMSYSDATKKDPNNPYAESMWAHWVLWNGGEAAEAQRHFANALASGRERPFVRQMELYAWLNRHDDASEEQVVQVANDIRKEGGTIAPDLKQRIFNMYYGMLIPPGDSTIELIQSVPPDEHVATFRWISDQLNLQDSANLLREGDLAVLEEAAGEKDDALHRYNDLKKRLSGQPGPLLAAAETGSRRLSANTR